MTRKIFIMAGESSGDLHGAMLVKHIKRLRPDFTFYGVGGRELESQGVSTLYSCSQFAAMGIVEPLLKIRFYKKALEKISQFITSNRIKTIILIDFPGFNLMLAERLKADVKIIYYISPQLWAWHYSRIKKIKKFVDSIIVLYPFEEEMYKKEGVRAFFAGNPIVDIVNEKLAIAEELKFKTSKPCIVILPGSRMSEARKHIVPLLEASALLFKRYNSSVIIPVLSGETGNFIAGHIRKNFTDGNRIRLVFDNTHRAIEKADIVITSSGTATLETALLGKQMIVIYKVGIIFELFARILIRIKNISLVNIVAGKKICPELLQRDVNGKRIYLEAVRLLDNKEPYYEMRDEIIKVREKLGKPGAIIRIAELAVSLIEE